MAGGLLAGLLFILPGFAVIMAMSAVHIFLSADLTVVAGVLFGLKAAVLAIVVEALMRVSRRALKTRLAWTLELLAFIAIAFLKLPFPLIVLGAGIDRGAGAGAASRKTLAISARHGLGNISVPSTDLPGLTGPPGARAPPPPRALAPPAHLADTLGLGRGVACAAGGPSGPFPACPRPWPPMALFFSKAAIVTFGGAYAVLAYVGQQAVEVHGWLMPGDMLAGRDWRNLRPGR